MAAPGVMIAQAIGRWGNFVNGEAHGFLIGKTTTFHFLGTGHVLESGEGSFFHTIRMGVSDSTRDPVNFYHPTFLYESLWNVLGFVLINLFYKRKKYDGQVALLYFTWYGFGRMIIEGFRDDNGDSLYIPGTSLRISQCLGLLCFVAGLALLLVLFFRKYREPVFVSAAKVGATEEAPSQENAEEEAKTEDAEVVSIDLTAAEGQEMIPEHDTEPASEDANDGEAVTNEEQSEDTKDGNAD